VDRADTLALRIQKPSRNPDARAGIAVDYALSVFEKAEKVIGEVRIEVEPGAILRLAHAPKALRI